MKWDGVDVRITRTVGGEVATRECGGNTSWQIRRIRSGLESVVTRAFVESVTVLTGQESRDWYVSPDGERARLRGEVL